MSNIKFKEVNAVAIIPAKGNSTRLPKKNFQMINDKSLVEYAIDYAKSSAYVKKIYVSTDSIEIKEIAEKNNVLSFERPKDLLGEAEVADIFVYEDSLNYIK